MYRSTEPGPSFPRLSAEEYWLFHLQATDFARAAPDPLRPFWEREARRLMDLHFDALERELDPEA